MSVIHWVLAAIAAYLAVIAAMYFAQTWLLFPTGFAEAGRPQLPAAAEHLEVNTPDGERLVGVRIPAIGEAEPGRTILGFGGNAWNGEAVALYLHGLFPDHDVVAFHYRGYGPSTGRPSAEALLADSLAVFDVLRQADPTGDVIAVGFSIGAGVAAYLARHRALSGLILVTPFDSLEALARDHYWWAPVGLLLRHRMPTIDFVRESSIPTAVIAAEHDRIVPARRSAPLTEAIPSLVLARSIDAGHNELYGHPAFAAAMREALDLIESADYRGESNQ
jgi:uncharacterized protein